MKSNPTRICAVLGVVILLLALLVEGLALEYDDVLMIGLGLLLAATSMELFRRAHPPAP